MGCSENNNAWTKWVPFGLIGQTKPRHFREMFGVLWDNRDNLSYAWKILNHGVCDGCSLGPRGLRDDVIPGVHLCMTRLKLLRVNTMPALDPRKLENIEDLSKLTNAELQNLGRLAFPMIRRRGSNRFERLNWDKAYDYTAKTFKKIDPDRMGFFASSRGITNEVYYVFQKLARSLGSPNVDLCSRLCHAATVNALKETVGVAAPTCQLSDLIGTDLLVLFGTDLANNQPVTTKYLHYAKEKGTRVIVINPMREHGLRRYWVPSVASSALFGTKIADEFYDITSGGDIAFINGVMKYLIEMNACDKGFIDAHTKNFDQLRQSLQQQTWEELEQSSGLTRLDMHRFAEVYAKAKSAVFVWSMGLTQHKFGVQNVKAVVNLALSRGMIGREKCGLMPIRGHSGVQGGGECGTEPDRFPGGFDVNAENASRFSSLWGFDVPSKVGLKTPVMIDHAYEGDIDILYNLGGNLLETLPDRNFVKNAISRIPYRIHQDIVLNTSTLLDSGEWTLVLPAQTRYEQRDGGTSTSTERRIRFTPEITGHQIGESRPEWEIPIEIGRRVHPEGERIFPYRNTQSIREEMAKVMPMYQGIETLHKEGQWLQWGGTMLLKDGVCPKMPAGRAHFSSLTPPKTDVPEGKFLFTTRRGKQFNSMVLAQTDALMGHSDRYAIFLNDEDASKLKLSHGDRIRLRSEVGEYEGHVVIAPLRKKMIQAYWPEANVLIPRVYDPVSGEPDYHAIVELEKV